MTPQTPRPQMWSPLTPECLTLTGTDWSILQAPRGPGHWLILRGAEVIDARPTREVAKIRLLELAK